MIDWRPMSGFWLAKLSAGNVAAKFAGARCRWPNIDPATKSWPNYSTEWPASSCVRMNGSLWPQTIQYRPVFKY